MPQVRFHSRDGSSRYQSRSSTPTTGFSHTARALSPLKWVVRMNAAARLIDKAHDYEVLAASHSEREALVGGGDHLEVRSQVRSGNPTRPHDA